MSLRASMELDKKHYAVPGRLPEFGAIFMSNIATKRECFRREMFGLPSSQISFVKQVKAGMILFLFEYERRELYGVFQACSNGEVNIIPHAFSSCGNQFPAQIKFNQIWKCRPLSEGEFCDAIKENYFSAKKFHFGLSKDQVYRLLLLFRSKKFEHQQPERQSTRSVERLYRYTKGGIKSVGDKDRVVMSDRVKDERDAGNDDGPVILTDYFGQCLDKVGRASNSTSETSDILGNYHQVENQPRLVISNNYVADSSNRGRTIDDGGYETRNRIIQERGTSNELGPVNSTGYPGCTLGEVRTEANDGFCPAFSTEYSDTENELHDYIFRPAISTKYPELSHTHLHTSAHSGKAIIEIDKPFIQDQSSPFGHSNIPYSRFHGDPSLTRFCPYPDAPSIDYKSSVVINNSYDSVQECAAQNSNFENAFRSGNQSISLHVEPKRHSRSADAFSSFQNNVSPPSCKTSMPLLGGAYGARQFSGIEGYKSLDFSESSLPTISLQGSGDYGMENKGPSTYTLSPTKSSPFDFDYCYHVAPQDKFVCEVSKCKDNEPCTANFSSSSEGQLHLQGSIPRSAHYHDNSSVNLEVEHHKHRVSVYPGQRNRNSVFSRLAVAPEVNEEEMDRVVGNDENDTDMSVNEVMRMLQQRHFPWVKKKKSKLPIRRYDDANDNQNKRLTSINSESETMTSKRINLNGISVGVGKGEHMAENVPFVEFKRRSEVRKIHDVTKISNCDESGKSRVEPGGKSKRRKLIRPDFSKNEPFDNKGIDSDISQHRHTLAQENFVNGDNSVGCEVLLPTRVTEDNLSQNIGLLQVMCRINCEDKKIDAERGSNLNGDVRKIDDEIQTTDCDECAKSGDLPGGESKWRKLIRPNFRKNESSNNDVISHDTSQNQQSLAQENAVSELNSVSCKVLLPTHVREDNVSQKIGLLQVTCQLSCEDKKIDAQRGSNLNVEVRNIHDETRIGYCGESVKSGTSPGGQSKRKRLIRPTFSKNE